jgi:cytochrome b involved in lipid metabolism|eukprot:CAMPEP_0174297218 /NCGR_PEP_ID=MMETSP0809-20121228/50386_1 /TAXON_ID=73025 ORGANISM="Eutreptiella gymnastica-like, Strain CCMP1594" /NCGR_SAMPLE_ID=MMETSP0809 /ASSEMBLY_ACC=CAM_ASM_000658 /LENGTH=83 /DNA_ID=CAMNT_0015400861 /DNA_START=23 /DNA_END=274 /DNA_ORIENTATION=+
MAAVFTMAEVAKHNKEGDAWVVLYGKVYDVSDFLDEHPGGKKALLLYAGKDATNDFEAIHPEDVLEEHAADKCIGSLAPSSKL